VLHLDDMEEIIPREDSAILNWRITLTILLTVIIYSGSTGSPRRCWNPSEHPNGLAEIPGDQTWHTRSGASMFPCAFGALAVSAFLPYWLEYRSRIVPENQRRTLADEIFGPERITTSY